MSKRKEKEKKKTLGHFQFKASVKFNMFKVKIQRFPLNI